MSRDSIVLLSVRETGISVAKSYAFTIMIDSQTLDDRSLSPVESKEIREISSQYQMLLDQNSGAKKTDYLEILGSGLFHLFFEKAWDQIKSKGFGHRIRLVIASDIPEILCIPWEIAKPTDEVLFGYDSRLSILRLPGQLEAFRQFNGNLPAGPLRMVLATCSPKQSIDYQAEEESLTKSLDGLDVALDSCDLGTYEELKERVDRFKPQIVHLIGHAVVKDGQNYFAFETDNGLADLRTAGDIQKALPEVQLALMSCQGKNASVLENIGVELVKAGLPLVMTCPCSIENNVFAFREFYKDLSYGNSLYDAISSMRQAIGDTNKVSTASFAFPALYSCADQERIFDPRQRSPTPEPLLVRQLPLKNTTEGYSENFVGRRRDVQRLVPALSEGIVKTLILTGRLGCGKSALASRLARKLESEGFSVIAISSSLENPLSTSRLIDVLVNAFYDAAAKRKTLGRIDLANGIIAAIQEIKNSSNDKRLQIAIKALNMSQFLLVLDDLEPNLDETGQIKDPEVSRFYLMLLNDLKNSRAIITSERMPRNAMILPKMAWEYALGGLAKADFFRVLQRDVDSSERLRSGDLSYQKLEKIYEKTGGLPLCMDRVANVLKTVNPADLIVESPSFSQNLSSLCDECTWRLFGALDSISQGWLCKSAVYALPINLAGLEYVTGEPEERVRALAEEWNEKALSFMTNIGNGMVGIVIRKELRDWLTLKLSVEERRKAHEGAGDFYLKALLDNSYNELELTSLECSLEARSHFLAAGAEEKARGATNHISSTLMARGFYSEVVKLNQELLERFEHPMSMRWIAQAFMEQGDLHNSMEWYQRCLTSSSRSEEDEAASWHGIAVIELRQGRYEKAEEDLKKALEIYRQRGDEKGEAEILRYLASTDMSNGDYARAKERLNRSLEIQRKAEDLAAQANTLRDLISIDLHQKDREAAHRKLEDVLEIFRRLGQSSSEATTLYDLASLDMEKEDFDTATDRFRAVLEIRRQMGDRAGEAATLHNLAMIDAQKEKVREAGDKFKASLQIYQQIGDKSGEAAAFFQLGILGIMHSRMTEGMRLLAISGIILRSIGSDEVRICQFLSQIGERLSRDS